MKNLSSFLFFFLCMTITSYSQSELMLSSCDDLLFAFDDHTDVDNDGIVCETNVLLQNIAMYTNAEQCSIQEINWLILVDIDADGDYDIEYSSDLPASDNVLDDTNGNGIPDLYLPLTQAGQSQSITISDIQKTNTANKVLWQVMDECNVVIECEQTFQIYDDKSPIPYCTSVSVAVFDDPFDFFIHAIDFNVGSFDNCSDPDDIIVSFSGDTYEPTRQVTCDDVLNSPIELDIYFSDENGNTDFCKVLLKVIPTETVDCFPNETIEGYVLTEEGKPIKNAEVLLNCGFIECPMTRNTDANGYYLFNLPQNQVLGSTLTVSKDVDHLESVSTLDLVKIMRHILGLQNFTTPYQQIAADINGDTNIKASDLIVIRKLLLGVLTENPTNTSWKFVEENHEFDENDPWSTNLGSTDDPFSIEVVQNYNGTYDFIGVKVGNIID